MVLNIVYNNGSSRYLNLKDDFKWGARETDTTGNRRDLNIRALIHDLSNNNVLSYKLTSSGGKTLTKWKRH